MQLNRREFLRVAGLVAAGATLEACAPLYSRLAGAPQRVLTWPSKRQNQSFQALSRLTFGPRVEERERVAEIGLSNWVEEQLAPESIEDLSANLRVRRLEILWMDADQLEGWEKEEVIEQLKQGALLRQIYSRRQVYEAMVEFWTDHFNIAVTKGDGWFLKLVDDREVIRAHALGNFRELLGASAHSPAMLVYLDNQANNKNAPNENYAREIMELHTLGVNGGYTQSDVMELARCLTGWTVKRHFWLGEFTFDPVLHDNGVKTVLGTHIEAAGEREAEDVLDILATHPATARFLATKLVRRFICDDPLVEVPELVENAARTFLQTHGDVQTVLRTILLDGLAVQPEILRPKYKRPANFVASALRILNGETDGGTPLQEALGLMGQPTFEWPTPDGPPDIAAAWSSNLLPRWQFALSLARNELKGTRIQLGELVQASEAASPAELIDRLSDLLLGAPFPPVRRDDLARSLQSVSEGDPMDIAAAITAGMIASPAFQWR